jgi:methylated-DNA-[protein]-cysteine S-methyltransferase
MTGTMSSTAAETKTASLTVDSPVGALTLVERDGAIVQLRWGGPAGSDETALLRTAAAQLSGYFFCELKAFDLPLAPAGPDFHQAVWREMKAIPYGRTRTYGDLAAATGGSAQSVGTACGQNPIPIIVPCHRVVAANGKLGGFSGGTGVETKRVLLALENAQPPRAADEGDKPRQGTLF